MPVRSRRLALGRQVAANVFTTLYTVPTDRTLIVRSIWVQNQHTAAVDYVVRAVNSNTATACRVISNVALPSHAREYHDVWSVLEDGDSLEIRAGVANVLNYWISGALLLGDSS